MYKILPVSDKPIIDCYSADASLCSILQAYDELNPQMYLNSLFFFKKGNNTLRYAIVSKKKGCELLEKKYYEKEMSDIIIDLINEEKYVFIYLDQYFLSGSNLFNKEHLVHDFTLIYGYDVDKRLFYCSDNFQFGKYTKKEISFDEIYKARSYVLDNSNVKNKCIIAYKYNSDDEYELDHNLVRKVLQDYCNSSFDNIIRMNPTCLTDNVFGFNYGIASSQENNIFGISVYKWLQKYLLDYYTIDSYMDVRMFHFLINHKELLALFFQYMKKTLKNSFNHNYYIDVVNELTDRCYLNRNFILKNNRAKKKGEIDFVINNLEYIYEYELDMIQKLIKEL